MSAQKMYLCSAMAGKGNQIFASVSLIFADTKESAVGQMYAHAKTQYPGENGYTAPEVSATLVSEKTIRYAASIIPYSEDDE